MDRRASGSPDVVRLTQVLKRSVSHFCPPSMAEFREDIVQNAIVRILTALEKRKGGPAPPASYIWKIAFTATMDQIRRVRRRAEVPLDSLRPRDGIAERHSDPLLTSRARELGRGIQDCLDGLDRNRRLAVGFHLLGYKLAEIEILLGWKPKTLRNRLYRGMADLRRCLASKGLEP